MYANQGPLYINTSQYERWVGDRPMVIVDGGARGRLFDPFDRVRTPMKVLAFEPDADSVRQGHNGESHQTVVIDKALWSKTGQVKVHIAKNPATSSVYPPDLDLLKRFGPIVGVPARVTQRVVEVGCSTIDDAIRQLACGSPDFIKLDVHSAEYEALTGAVESLAHCVGLLVETWHSPIHRGQHLHAQVEGLLNSHGFTLFRNNPIASWRGAIDEKVNRFDRPQQVCSESLFFRDSFCQEASSRDAVVAIACADLFGYTHHAIYLSRCAAKLGMIDQDQQSQIESELQRLIRVRRCKGLPQRLVRRCRRAMDCLRGSSDAM